MSDTDASGRIGDYELLAHLSSGGMGDVVLARRTGTAGFEKLVAIKTLRADVRERSEIRSAFLDEARLVARLDHPTIAQVYDFGEQDGQLYLAMEYVAGVPLSRLIPEKGPIAPGIAAALMAEVCRGLHAAHELRNLDGTALGVVHRDISPQNILLSFAGRAKILDFGIALTRDRVTPHTELGTIKGKPGYMAPEQLTGAPVDRRADIFATGVVLHELLTGERLFAGRTLPEVVRAVDLCVVAPPSSLRPEVTHDLDDVVMRALRREPDERFGTAHEMATALESIARDSHTEPLATFAERELAENHAEHRAFLHEILTATGAAIDRPVKGRPRDVPTVEASVPQAAPGRRRGKIIIVTLALATALGGVAGLLALRHRGDVPPRAPQAVTQTVAPSLAVAVAVPAPVPVPAPTTASRPRRAGKAGRRSQSTAAAIPSAATGQGFLRVISSPWSNVRIDGVLLDGPTPLLKYRIAAGRHVVEIIDPVSGAVRKRSELTLEDGATARVEFP